MRRHQLFEAALVLAIIVLAGLLFIAVTTVPPARYSWETAANGSVGYMFVGSDDTLYLFGSNEISAIGNDGSRLWNLTIPAEWKVLNDWMMPIYTTKVIYDNGGERGGTSAKNNKNYPVTYSRNGYLYVYAMSPVTAEEIAGASDETGNMVESAAKSRPALLIAIAPNGSVRWERIVPGNISAIALQNMGISEGVETGIIPSLYVSDDRLYLFHDFVEDVFDLDGRRLFTLGEVSSPVAVGEDGTMYAIHGIPCPPGWPDEAGVYTGEMSYDVSTNDLLIPSSIVEAYAPDGTLAWRTDIGINTTRLYVDREVMSSYGSIPLYANHTLYVPVQRGFAALDTDGNLKWVRQVENGPMQPWESWRPWISRYAPLSMMPVDSAGNVYLVRLDWDVSYHRQADAIYVISPDGNVSLPGGNAGTDMAFDSGLESLAGKEGIIYATDRSRYFIYSFENTSSFDILYDQKLSEGGTIVAYDVQHAASLWNFTVPLINVTAITLNSSNKGEALLTAEYPISQDYSGLFFPDEQKDAAVYPGRDVIYVYYYYAAYETPVLYGKSRCVYAKCLCALDRDGKMLWEKPLDGFIMEAAAGNGTIYYLTSSGRMGGGTAGIAAGVALLAAAYLFLRFFLVGTVARARNRLDNNDNRNRVLRYVAENPGVTAVDVSRSLGINIGTIRYHLFVLAVNHKIVHHKEDEKYLRYFTNSGTYPPEARAVLSLLRRDSLRKMLRLLLESPGLTSPELAQQLGVSTTIAHRHLNELMARDVVVKVCGTEKGNVYLVNEKYRGITAATLGRVA